MAHLVAEPSAQTSDREVFSVFQGVADAWGLSVGERCELLSTNERTFYRWRLAQARLSNDQRLRISYVLNIYLDLHAISDTGETADSWIRKANRAFEEQPPLHVMTGSTVDLHRVYAYVHRFAV